MTRLALFTALSLSLLAIFTANSFADDSTLSAGNASAVVASNASPAEHIAAATYNAAYQETQDSGKPLVILVGASWCPACQSMKTAILPAVASKGGLANVAFAYVNTDAQSTLATQLLEGNSIPQLVMYEKSGDGWKLNRLIGAQSVEAVEAFIGPAAKAALAAKQDATAKQPVAAKQPADKAPATNQQSAGKQPSTAQHS